MIFTCQYSKLMEKLKQKETSQIDNMDENEVNKNGKKSGLAIAFQKIGSGIEIIEKEIEKEINQNEIEEEFRKKEIRRIELLIHQLMMQQKQLQSGSASRFEETSIYSIYNKGINASKNGSISGDMYDQITQSNRKAIGKHLKLHNQQTD